MEILTKYLIEEALIMIPALWIIAEIIKRTEKLDHKWIPVVVLVISLGFTPWFLGGYSASNLIQAVLVAGGEMLGYQLYDKTLRRE